MSREYLNALWELTKRELRRKYARSYLGIAWSSLYPLLRMALVVFMFTHIFNKPIDRYPAYYFTGYLIYEFLNIGSGTAVTTLRDNKDLIAKTKLSNKTFVLSRVNTAFINLLLGCIPYVGVLILYKAIITPATLIIIIDFFFLYLFVTGLSYLVSIGYVFFKDLKNIYSQILVLWRFFVAMFYLVEWVPKNVAYIIEFNPMYIFIKISRDCVIYGRVSESRYYILMVTYSILSFATGNYVFNKNNEKVLMRL